MDYAQFLQWFPAAIGGIVAVPVLIGIKKWKPEINGYIMVAISMIMSLILGMLGQVGYSLIFVEGFILADLFSFAAIFQLFIASYAGSQAIYNFIKDKLVEWDLPDFPILVYGEDDEVESIEIGLKVFKEDPEALPEDIE